MPRPDDQLADVPSADASRPPGPDPVHPRESDPVAAQLRDRMERLPPGHPSSPYNADGTRRPPEPDHSDREYPLPGDPDYRPDTAETADTPEHVAMAAEANSDRNSEPPADAIPGRDSETTADASPSRDSETTAGPAQLRDAPPHVEPLTDAEYAEHVQEVRERLDQGQSLGLATNDQFTIDDDGELWLEEREAFQDALVEELYARAADIPAEHQAIMAGGLPGAGKTTVLERHANVDRSRFLTINPDEIKEEMARRGLIPQIEGLSPMEASDLVHEESSLIAKRLANVAQAEGKNIIWDITMSSPSTAERRITDLRGNGYTYIDGIFVDIPPEVCKARAETRHRIGHEEYRAGKGEGGRLIPEDLIDRNHDPVWGSASMKTFEEVKHRFDKWSVYDNSADGFPPMLIDSSEMEERQR